jgi:hypothetical protein
VLLCEDAGVQGLRMKSVRVCPQRSGGVVCAGARRIGVAARTLFYHRRLRIVQQGRVSRPGETIPPFSTAGQSVTAPPTCLAEIAPARPARCHRHDWWHTFPHWPPIFPSGSHGMRPPLCSLQYCGCPLPHPVFAAAPRRRSIERCSRPHSSAPLARPQLAGNRRSTARIGAVRCGRAATLRVLRFSADCRRAGGFIGGD